MDLTALRELENWLEFPLDYAEGIVILAKLTASPSYKMHVGRVAEVALRSSEDVASDVGLYLSNAPKRPRVAPRTVRPVENLRSAVAKPVESPRVAHGAEYPLARRCHHCGHDSFYTREETRMTDSGKLFFIISILFLGLVALIPYFYMREKYYIVFCRNCNRKQDNG